MSIEIISHPETHTEVSFRRQYVWRNDTGAGFSFECDEEGNILPSNPDAEKNYQKCIDGTFDVIDRGVERHEHSWREPAVGRCHCGAEVELDSFTCTCEKCGRDYNQSGQELAPREHWGEETGETLSDIMRGGDPFAE